MTAAEYRVQLDAFEGPLDLLLYLIRRAEVDIHDIPIATIAEQFIEHLKGIERVDIETAGEFLLMASTLMEVKSRMLMPPGERGGSDASEPAGEGEGGEDPRAELVRQLLEYKRYRDAADALEQRLIEWRQRFPGGAAAAPEEPEPDEAEVDLEDLEVEDLVEAFARIIEAVDFDAIGAHEVHDDDTPTELHAEDLVDLLARRVESGQGESTLASVLEGRGRGEMIGLFIALLELVRQQRIHVRQDSGEVLLALASEGAAGEASSEVPGEVPGSEDRGE